MTGEQYSGIKSIVLRMNCDTFNVGVGSVDISQEKVAPTLLSGRYALAINYYGCISLEPLPLGTAVPLPHPGQHELQIDQWQSVLKEQARKKEEDAARTRKYIFEKPGEHGGGG